MKFVSLLLRLAALAAAGVCVFFWLDSRGKISAVDGNLDKAGLNGADVVEKSEGALALSKSKADLERKNAAKDKVNKELELKLGDLTSDLEGERTKTIQLSGDLSKKNSELRAANSSVSSLKSQISSKNALIENLKREIIAAKESVTQTPKGENLADKVSSLESELAAKSKELEDTQAKLKILEQGEVIQVVETDPNTGKQVAKKIIKKPYVPTGDMAAVIDFDEDNMVMAINKTASDGLQEQQNILFLRDGTVVAEAKVCELKGQSASLLINRKAGIPETIEIGDVLEMSSPEAQKAKAAKEASALAPQA